MTVDYLIIINKPYNLILYIKKNFLSTLKYIKYIISLIIKYSNIACACILIINYFTKIYY